MGFGGCCRVHCHRGGCLGDWIRRDRTFSRRSLHGQVAHELGRRILAGEIVEGEFLSTEEMASREHSVSRTAYREAVKVLTAKGLLESRPKTGTRVRPRNDWNLLDPDVLRWASEVAPTASFADTLFEFRLIVEPAAARLAAEKQIDPAVGAIRDALEVMETTEPAAPENVNADLAFHTAILRASGNSYLSSLNHMVEALLEWSFGISTRRAEMRAASVPLHRAVFEQIERAEGEAAHQAMVCLLRNARQDIDRVMRVSNGDSGAADENNQGLESN